MRWCPRCEVRRLADCSIVCFATRQHDDLSHTDHALYVTDSDDDTTDPTGTGHAA